MQNIKYANNYGVCKVFFMLNLLYYTYFLNLFKIVL